MPHSETRGSARSAAPRGVSSPCHVLHRHGSPRHPPRAGDSLARAPDPHTSQQTMRERPEVQRLLRRNRRRTATPQATLPSPAESWCCARETRRLASMQSLVCIACMSGFEIFVCAPPASPGTRNLASRAGRRHHAHRTQQQPPARIYGRSSRTLQLVTCMRRDAALVGTPISVIQPVAGRSPTRCPKASAQRSSRQLYHYTKTRPAGRALNAPSACSALHLSADPYNPLHQRSTYLDKPRPSPVRMDKCPCSPHIPN